MRIARFSKLLFITYFLLLPLTSAGASPAVPPADETSRLLPDAIKEFRARGQAQTADAFFAEINPEDYGVVSAATRTYISDKGHQFKITIIKARTDGAAYSLLTATSARLNSPILTSLDSSQTAGIIKLQDGLAFVHGPLIVNIKYSIPEVIGAGREEVVRLVTELSMTLEPVENDLPVLIKHLPDWENVRNNTPYAVSLPVLQTAAGGRPVLDAISFEGGAEAVTATYGPSRLVIVENTTPQLATTQDARINARLKELRDSGQPVPTLYRRVGNYSVFVFDAPDEATAAKLVDSIKYEQVVQWLGDNPNDLRRAQRRYTETTAGVIIAVLRASGLSLLLCLGVGAIFGGIVFRRRRQQQTAQEAFSDAGGMVRLNLDEMTAQYDSGKLLGPSKQG